MQLRTCNVTIVICEIDHKMFNKITVRNRLWLREYYVIPRQYRAPLLFFVAAFGLKIINKTDE